jgi:hypothetical protein
LSRRFRCEDGAAQYPSKHQSHTRRQYIS